MTRFRENGFQTASRFTRERTKAELARIFAALCNPDILQDLDGWLKQIRE